MKSSTPSPTASYKISHSSEASQHAATFEGWVDNKLHQLSKQVRFDALMYDHLIRPEVRLNAETLITPSIEQFGYVPTDKIVLVHMLSPEGVLMNGRLVNSETIYMASGKTVHAVTKSAVRTNLLMVDKTYLFELSALRSLGISESMPFERFIRPSSGLTLEFHQCVEDHLKVLKDESSSAAAVSASATRILVSAQELLEGDAEDEQIHLSTTTRTYIVERSCELFLANLDDEQYGVLDLCSRLKVSRRTLQYSFETVLGMSPTHYMRSVRLNMARHAMISQPYGKIQGAALDAGFPHVARFSKYYFDFYGELPSVTVAKHNNATRQRNSSATCH
jgi:AraC family transcriptional regulator, ethanolamine operon transcriptional activator